jgi:hypothetical protein
MSVGGGLDNVVVGIAWRCDSLRRRLQTIIESKMRYIHAKQRFGKGIRNPRNWRWRRDSPVQRSCRLPDTDIFHATDFTDRSSR